MLGTLRGFIVFVVPVYTRAYVPKAIFGLEKSAFARPSTMLPGLRVRDIPFSDGKEFSQYTAVSMRCFVISLV